MISKPAIAKKSLFSFGRFNSLVKALAIILPLAFSANIALAQNEVDPNAVVAKVGNDVITEADLSFAAEDLAEDLARVPQSEHRGFLISVMIDMKIMAQAARKVQMDKSEIYAARLSYLEDRALRRAYFTNEIGVQITPELVKKSYDDFVEKFEPQKEVRARHILVSSEEDIKKIKTEIENGKLFEMAAMEYSSDTRSAKEGGDLGYFRHKDMTETFEKIAFALEIGQVSEPFESPFGWHIIKVEDNRMTSPPTFEQVQGQLAQQQLIVKFNETIIALKNDVKIEITDSEISKAILGE